jgi:tRNA-Thr(GGU) m(6)t(6)A37 methyltransferase TsaA
MEFNLTPIGIVRSCYKEKFGVPRQPGLVTAAEAFLELSPPYDREEALRGLESFSHAWVLFIFHQALQRQWKPMVRPPRLGGNRRLGVFATRSPFRPNPVGLSAVELGAIERRGGRLRIQLIGADLVDGTPVLDIKPYVPYADSIATARGGYADGAPTTNCEVVFESTAEKALEPLPDAAKLRELIIQVLRQDPRPAYRDNGDEAREYGMHLYDVNVRWRHEGGCIRVLGIVASHDNTEK